MLKRLRIKFIALNMVAIATVLVITFTAICVITHQKSVTQVNGTLDAAIEKASEGNRAPAFDAGATDAEEMPEPAPEQGSSPAPPTIGGKHGGGDQAIPVAVYVASQSGGGRTAWNDSTAALSDAVLEQAATQLADAPDGTGTLTDLGLVYSKRTEGASAYLAFADVSTVEGWRSLALTLAGLGMATLAVFLVISVFFSKWALRPVERAWRQQRQFVADASHDLKTPLTVILANSSILLDHPTARVASQSQWVESTQHEAQAMQELVSDLLLLAKMDEEKAAGRHVGTPLKRAQQADIDMSDLVEGELLQFESVAFERSIDLHTNVQPGLHVHGSEARLRRLVSTLVDNACKYCDGNGSVTATLTASGCNATFSVHNTGPAIAADDLPHVFDRFYRADKARTSGAGGHGLGLSIAQAIAQEHGGSLRVESSAATGTTFAATVPLAR